MKLFSFHKIIEKMEVLVYHYIQVGGNKMDYSVIIVAAGQGSRMNLGYNKVFYQLENKKTILEMTIDCFKKDRRCSQIVVVTDREAYSKYVGEYFGKLVLVAGGETRQESVYRGLLAVTQKTVLIHDGARPYVSMESLDRLCQCLEGNDAALLGVWCKDTIKEVEGGCVEQTLNREKLIQAQTPQGFKTDLLWDCYQQAMKSETFLTDDAAVVERFSSTPIRVVDGDYQNIKITTVEDLK